MVLIIVNQLKTKTNYNKKIKEIEKPDHNKHITTLEFNKLTTEILMMH